MEIALSILLIAGSLFALIGSIGLTILPDTYMRLHGPTKATTLGVGCTLLASVVYFSFKNDALSIYELLIAVFLFMTAPVSGMLLAKAARYLNLPAQADLPEAFKQDKPEE